MAGRGKRRARRRLLRWAAPLFHGGECRNGPDCQCRPCEAPRYLQPEDWYVLDFYRLVWDQVENLTPLGAEEGKLPWHAPRLEAWCAVAHAHGIPDELRPELFARARYLHDAVRGRIQPDRDDLAANPADLLPQPED